MGTLGNTAKVKQNNRSTPGNCVASEFGSTTSVLPSTRGAAPVSTDTQLRGKRIAMVTFSPYPYDPRPRRTISALLKEGANVDLVCLQDRGKPKREIADGLDVTRVSIANRRGGKLSYAYQYGMFILISSAILALRLFKRRYDLVYVNNMPDILVLSALIPKMLGAKVILDLHDPMPELMTTIFNLDPNSLSVRVIRELEKWSMARTDHVLTVNLACKRIFGSRSCPPEKIGVVMNSPDEDIFPSRALDSRRFVARDLNQPFVIMYHGSLVERNGVDLAVDAMTKVRKQIPTAELRIYGSDSPFLQRVMEKVKNQGLQDAVHYLGRKQLEELISELERCDLGVIPNQRNAFTEINTPTRIFEYLAFGKPLIAPRTPGIQDYFSEGSLLFFEPGNSNDLARLIEWVYSHPSEVMQITERGQRVHLEHTWSQERQTLVNALSQVLDGGKSN